MSGTTPPPIGTCDPAIININSVLYGNVPSGGTENVVVKDEDGNIVGSLIGGEWIVPIGGAKDLFLYLNYLDTNDVIEVLGDSNNIGTYTTIPSGMEYSTDGINYVALTNPFTLSNTVNYYFKRLTALVSETKILGGTYV